MSNGHRPPPSRSASHRLMPFFQSAVAYATFATLGMTVGFRGVAWPSIRSSFDLPLDAIGPWLVAATAGSIVSSFNGGYAASLMGVGPLLVISGLTAAFGLLGYGVTSQWWLMVSAGLVTGLGSGVLHVGLNAHFTAWRGAGALNCLHACFGLGAMVGPLVMTWIIGTGSSWRWGYRAAGTGLVLLAVCFALTRRHWTGSTEQREGLGQTGDAKTRLDTLRLPIVWLSLLLFFAYTGVESTAGQWVYSLFTEARSIRESTAGLWMTVYWGGIAAGRLVLGGVADRLGTISVLRLAMLTVVAGTGLIWWETTDLWSFAGLTLMGLAQGPIFPSLVSLTPNLVSAGHVDNTIGFQVAAASLGAAALSSLAGVMARRMTLEIVGPFLLVGAAAMLVLYEIMLRRGAQTPLP